MPCCVAQFGVPAIVEGGPQVGLPCTLASLHPWGVAPASWVRCALALRRPCWLAEALSTAIAQFSHGS